MPFSVTQVSRRVLCRLIGRLRKWPVETLGVREAYACLADSYPAHTRHPFMQLEQATMLGLLPDVAGKRVLDVACGTGRYLEILRERGAARTFGVDLSPEMLGKASGLGAIARCDLRALPVASGQFDVVICGLAVGYVAALGDAIAEMGRVLVPGGTLVYSDVHPLANMDGRARAFSV